MPGAINTIRRLRINKRRIRTSYRSLSTDCMSIVNNPLYVNTTDNNNEEVQLLMPGQFRTKITLLMDVSHSDYMM